MWLKIQVNLIVYGGYGKAARNWESYDKILEALTKLENDETLLIQSGKPVAVFRTHEYSPRVIISNSMLVPNWANWDHFRQLDEKGLMMYGQMTAGSWIYIGTQGILQGTYETLAEIARREFNGSLKGTLTLTAGLGGMGGAQPLAVTMNEGVNITVEVNESRIDKRLETQYLDMKTDSFSNAIEYALKAKEEKKPLSIGLIGNAADIFPKFIENNIIPEIVTDQTSAHDELYGYVPNELSFKEAVALRDSDPNQYIDLSYKSMSRHCAAMLEMQKKGSIVFDYGNNLRGQAKQNGGLENAFDYPGFVPEYIRPLFCEGKGPFRWVALSGNPEDIYKTDKKVLELFPNDDALRRWITMAQERLSFKGFLQEYVGWDIKKEIFLEKL